MKVHFLSSLLISLAICATAHANPGHAGMVATSMPLDLNLVACHATMAGLTVLGMVMSLGRWPWSRGRRERAVA